MPKPRTADRHHAVQGGGTGALDRLWSEAWDREFLAGTPNKAPHAAATDAWAVMDFNRLQRARREGWQAHYKDSNVFSGRGPERDAATTAAKAFPLKKRVPRVVIDPTEPSWLWRRREDGECAEVKMGPHAWDVLSDVRFTPDRIRMLYDLIQNPWVYVDDTEPETQG